MAISFFDQEQHYVLNHFRAKRIRDGYLVTTDYGSWVYLDKEEFNLLRNNKILENSQLFNLLKNKGIIITINNINEIVHNTRKRLDFLFKGVYHHIIFFDDSKNYNNIKNIIDFIIQSPFREIIIDIRSDLIDFDIIKNIIAISKQKNSEKNKSLSFKLTTNFDSINKELLDFLINEKIELWTFYQNAEKNIEAIKTIQRRYNINLFIDVNKEILSKSNILDELQDLKIRHFFLKRSNEITNFEFLSFWKNILNQLIEINKKEHLREILTDILLRKILNVNDANYAELQSLCSGVGINQLSYNLKGDIFIGEEGFSMEIFKLGDISQSYDEIFKSEELKSIVKASIEGSFMFENDAFYPFIGFCPVCCYKDEGNLVPKKDNKRFNLYSEMLKHLFKQLIFDNRLKHII